jgi:hypothetical protein
MTFDTADKHVSNLLNPHAQFHTVRYRRIALAALGSSRSRGKGLRSGEWCIYCSTGKWNALDASDDDSQRADYPPCFNSSGPCHDWRQVMRAEMTCVTPVEHAAGRKAFNPSGPATPRLG